MTTASDYATISDYDLEVSDYGNNKSREGDQSEVSGLLLRQCKGSGAVPGDGLRAVSVPLWQEPVPGEARTNGGPKAAGT